MREHLAPLISDILSGRISHSPMLAADSARVPHGTALVNRHRAIGPARSAFNIAIRRLTGVRRRFLHSIAAGQTAPVAPPACSTHFTPARPGPDEAYRAIRLAITVPQGLAPAPVGAGVSATRPRSWTRPSPRAPSSTEWACDSGNTWPVAHGKATSRAPGPPHLDTRADVARIDGRPSSRHPTGRRKHDDGASPAQRLRHAHERAPRRAIGRVTRVATVVMQREGGPWGDEPCATQVSIDVRRVSARHRSASRRVRHRRGVAPAIPAEDAGRDHLLGVFSET
ncbi:hypothetical protein ACVW07_002294 [Cellulomonas sp. URHB0016]